MIVVKIRKDEWKNMQAYENKSFSLATTPLNPMLIVEKMGNKDG